MLKRALYCQVLLITVICVVESPSHCLSSFRELVALQEYSDFVLFSRGPLRYAPPDAEHLPGVRQEPPLLPPG